MWETSVADRSKEEMLRRFPVGSVWWLDGELVEVTGIGGDLDPLVARWTPTYFPGPGPGAQQLLAALASIWTVRDYRRLERYVPMPRELAALEAWLG